MLVGVHSTNTVTVLQKVEQLAQVSELSVESFSLIPRPSWFGNRTFI